MTRMRLDTHIQKRIVTTFQMDVERVDAIYLYLEMPVRVNIPVLMSHRLTVNYRIPELRRGVVFQVIHKHLE